MPGYPQDGLNKVKRVKVNVRTIGSDHDMEYTGSVTKSGSQRNVGFYRNKHLDRFFTYYITQYKLSKFAALSRFLIKE